jgi:predicted component of type VI protein secretion system
MIQSSCEMITLGRSGYPKNIPRDTVDKLCMKMYPPFANRGKKTAAGAGGSTDFSMVNAAVLVVMTVGMIYYVVSSSTPEESAFAQPPPAWEINRIATNTPAPASPPASASPVACSPASASAGSVTTQPLEKVMASSPVSESAESVTTPTSEQIMQQRVARLQRFDSSATEQS